MLGVCRSVLTLPKEESCSGTLGAGGSYSKKAKASPARAAPRRGYYQELPDRTVDKLADTHRPTRTRAPSTPTLTATTRPTRPTWRYRPTGAGAEGGSRARVHAWV